MKNDFRERIAGVEVLSVTEDEVESFRACGWSVSPHLAYGSILEDLDYIRKSLWVVHYFLGHRAATKKLGGIYYVFTLVPDDLGV